MFELRCSEFELFCSESAGQPQDQGVGSSKSSMKWLSLRVGPRKGYLPAETQRLFTWYSQSLDGRQLEFPAVLPHRRMLPKISLKNVTEQNARSGTSR